ncbi:hypothetical protein C5167_039955 [Papaver somniferum]|uniref:Uncharacterized protein n=2 Tax=Papaver somniferum TaxID=3469 RepID=A0A4Y7IDP8_PAPSO|nr:hypothetical protein C5167_039955 [Papaver somniferum]
MGQNNGFICRLFGACNCYYWYSYPFDQFVVIGKISSLTGTIFLGIACYLLMIVLLHFSLVIQAIIYFVCRSYHNEEIANVAQHLEGGPNAHIVRGKDEAFRITFSRKKIFSQVTLTAVLPLSIILLSSIQVSYFIGYPINVNSRGIGHWVFELLYAIFTLFFTLLTTSMVVYIVACIYTSRDITFKRVIGVFPKVWGRLIVTFLWCLLVWVIYTGVAIGLFLWFFLSVNDGGQENDKVLIFGICLFIPFMIGSVYMENVWSVAMVISVLEDDYGRKALGKSMKLIKGKVWVSSSVFLTLHFALSGVVFAFSLLVVYGDILSLERKIYVGIACSVLLMLLIHFTLVIQTIFYFVCKSYNDEDSSNVAKHLDVGYANLVSDIQIQRASV